MINDNAKLHHANLHAQWRGGQELAFTLEILPPYSPQLNAIERLWKLTRRLCLGNRYFPTLEAVVAAVEGTFDTWTTPNIKLKRLCAVS